VLVEGWIFCCENKGETARRRDRGFKKVAYLLLKKYNETNSIANQKRAPRRKQLRNEHFQFIDEAMEDNRELTSGQFHGLVVEKYPDLNVSISTIKRTRRALGRNSKKTRYCAIFSEIKKTG